VAVANAFAATERVKDRTVTSLPADFESRNCRMWSRILALISSAAGVGVARKISFTCASPNSLPLRLASTSPRETSTSDAPGSRATIDASAAEWENSPKRQTCSSEFGDACTIAKQCRSMTGAHVANGT